MHLSSQIIIISLAESPRFTANINTSFSYNIAHTHAVDATMTSQQQAIMETVLALRRTLKRSAYAYCILCADSDSDSSIDQTTNRGNKLKKRARFVHQGRLASADGPVAYKEMAEHAGYQRAIIYRNPPLVDEDGYDLDSEDEEDEQVQEAMAAAMESNPYSSVHIEQLLAPLTSVTDLPSHPTLARPFTSTALTELVQQAMTLMHKENKALWKAKPLLTKLIGDNTWAPCGLMAAPDDQDARLFTDTASFFNRPRVRPAAVPTANGVPAGPADDETAETKKPGAEAGKGGQEAQTTQAADNTEQGKKVENKTRDDETLPDADGAPNGSTEELGSQDKTQQGGGNQAEGDAKQDGSDPVSSDNNATKPNGQEDVDMAEAPASGSATEAQKAARPDGPPAAESQATALSSMSITAAASSIAAALEPPTAEEDAAFFNELFIHPLFRLPSQAHPDRDLGLPEQEAEEVRRLLLLYVQKQEEICRGARRLVEGLLRADRLRRQVFGWAKAEAHCGPNRDMSDGEDWYDREEWGLTEDLKKGEDEVEEDTTQTQKKTRNRK
ncbi:hypothetical protein VTJ49DRAFT_5606 [Mycothermus thermophilus]|uniref:Transcriptional regulatory protein RXT2 N-terminal domain-containing protein n=1 Tax=Humicola insolens TaxID=85995 RepID=A0ABR3V2T5_HUMIN